MVNWNKPIKKSTGLLVILLAAIVLAGGIKGYQAYPGLVNAGLYMAIEKDSEGMIKWFIRMGADKKEINRLLLTAVKSNNPDRVAFALRSGADPDTPSPGNYPLLYGAVYEGRFEITKLLVQHGADMDFTTKSGWSILGMAISRHKNKIGRLLIESGADLDPPNKKIRRKPLWIAVKKSNQPMLKMLLDRGVTTPMVDEEKEKKSKRRKPYTLLHYALRYDNYEAAKLLIQGYGKARLPEELLDGEPFISNYCLMGIKRLLTRRKLETKGVLDPNPIVVAVEQAQSIEGVSGLINRYPGSINRADSRGVTPLIAAIESGRKDLVEKLLLSGADPGQADLDGIPPITIALSLKAYDIAQQLVYAGVELDDSGCHGDSMFYYAIQRNDINALKLIVGDKEAVNRVYSPSGPPLVLAMSYGQERLEMVRLLLEAGASPYISGHLGSGADYIRKEPVFAEFKVYLTGVSRTDDKKEDTTGGPAFDCARAGNTVETRICSDTILAQKDRVLNKVYQSLLSHNLEGLKQAQLDWLTERDTCELEGSGMMACLNAAYDKRIDELQAHATALLSSEASSWQKHFVNTLDEIPINAFRASYFDERMAGEVKYTKVVERPAVNFTNDTYFGIPGESFGAYWIGFHTFEETTLLEFNIYKSRAEVKLFINGQELESAWSVKNGIPFTFAPGTHKIEILYLSNYFSVSFLLDMMPPVLPVDDVTLLSSISAIENPKIWYCGAYESQNIDMGVSLSLKPSDAPVVLVLCSWQPIVWELADTGRTDLRQVILSSHHSRSRIKNLPDHVKLAHYDDLPNIYELIPKKGSSNTKRSFKNLAYKIQSITGKKPVGFSGKYGLTDITVPKTVLDDKLYSKFGMRLHGKGRQIPPDSKSRIDHVFEE